MCDTPSFKEVASSFKERGTSTDQNRTVSNSKRPAEGRHNFFFFGWHHHLCLVSMIPNFFLLCRNMSSISFFLAMDLLLLYQSGEPSLLLWACLGLKILPPFFLGLFGGCSQAMQLSSKGAAGGPSLPAKTIFWFKHDIGQWSRPFNGFSVVGSMFKQFYWL